MKGPPDDPGVGKGLVGVSAGQAGLGNLHLYWPQLLVAMETLLHLVYQPQQRGPGDFMWQLVPGLPLASGEEAVQSPAGEELVGWRPSSGQGQVHCYSFLEQCPLA